MYHTRSKKRFLKPICQLFVAKSGQRDSKILSPIFAPFKRGKESISSCRLNLVRTSTIIVDIAEVTSIGTLWDAISCTSTGVFIKENLGVAHTGRLGRDISDEEKNGKSNLNKMRLSILGPTFTYPLNVLSTFVEWSAWNCLCTDSQKSSWWMPPRQGMKLPVLLLNKF